MRGVVFVRIFSRIHGNEFIDRLRMCTYLIASICVHYFLVSMEI